MSRLLPASLVLIALASAGCGVAPMTPGARALAGNMHAQSRKVAPPPMTTPTLPAVAGDWVVGAGAETDAPGPVAGCMSHWHLGTDGKQYILDADNLPDSGPMPDLMQFEHATGTLDNGTLTLTGQIQVSAAGPGLGMHAPQPLTYTLTLDPTKGHLAGTRNGAPFWAAPFKTSDAAACGGEQP